MNSQTQTNKQNTHSQQKTEPIEMAGEIHTDRKMRGKSTVQQDRQVNRPTKNKKEKQQMMEPVVNTTVESTVKNYRWHQARP